MCTITTNNPKAHFESTCGHLLALCSAAVVAMVSVARKAKLDAHSLLELSKHPDLEFAPMSVNKLRANAIKEMKKSSRNERKVKMKEAQEKGLPFYDWKPPEVLIDSIAQWFVYNMVEIQAKKGKVKRNKKISSAPNTTKKRGRSKKKVV